LRIWNKFCYFLYFKKLFQPGIIRKLKIKNRLINAPCEKNYANPDGSVTQRYIDYTVERAKGGVGLILPESMYIDPQGRNHLLQLGIYDDKLIPGLKKLTTAVQKYGCKIGAEIQFAGRQTSSLITGLRPVAPSPIPCKVLAGGEVPRELTIEEIHKLVKKFGEAARRAKEAGFDLVEIHGAHGYIIGQFLSPFSNKRKDEYGGDSERRMRFPLEVVAEVRRAVGHDYPVAYRISAHEYVDGGLTLEDIIPFVQKLEQAGVDLIDVSAGIYESVVWIAQPSAFPQGCLVDLAYEIKKSVNIPVAVAGRINNPELAESILEEGKADFIAMGRALHADPYLPKKAQEGRLQDIRRCPACMRCSDELGTNLPISCTVNPAVGKERELIINPTSKKKSVMVIGGGPAGMKAAAIAAQRGHNVTLYEKKRELGGMARLACKVSHKKEFEEVIKYLLHEVEMSGARIRLNTEVTLELVEKVSPDVVIVATGSCPVFPFTPGIDKSHNVYTALEVLEGNVTPSGTILIMGGGLIGCETAKFICKKEVDKVIIVEPAKEIGRGIGLREGWYLLNEIKKDSKIEVRTRTTVEEIRENLAIIQSEGKYEEIYVDYIILATGLASNNQLADLLKERGEVSELYTIGDCVLPRKVEEAIYEGLLVSRQI